MPNFIIDNQVLFIVLGVLVIMAIIGYIADKNNVGKKEKTTKKEKEEKALVQEIKAEEVVENIEAIENEPIQNNELELYEEPVTINNDIILEPATIERPNEDLTVPLEGIQTEQDAAVVASSLGVDPAILTTPLEGNLSGDEFGIDNVPSLHIDNTSKEGTEDDVWKF